MTAERERERERKRESESDGQRERKRERERERRAEREKETNRGRHRRETDRQRETERFQVLFHYTDALGIVPANGGVEIIVTFAPTEFSTAIMMLQVRMKGIEASCLAQLSLSLSFSFSPQLEVSQFNSKPLVATFTGTSIPGLLV